MKKETIHTKACPRCGAPFICRPDNPSICQCAGIVLNENARAYLGKLMVELKVKKQEQLKKCAKPFDGNLNYQKIVIIERLIFLFTD